MSIMVILISVVSIAAELNITLIDSQDVDQAGQCYDVARELSKVASSTYERTLPKFKLAFADEDALYTIYKLDDGSTCAILQNQGANDMAWGFGFTRLNGCECHIVYNP